MQLMAWRKGDPDQNQPPMLAVVSLTRSLTFSFLLSLLPLVGTFVADEWARQPASQPLTSLKLLGSMLTIFGMRALRNEPPSED